MSTATDPPPGMMVLDLGKDCVLVIPISVYVAGLRLGKALRRRERLAQRARDQVSHRQGRGKIMHYRATWRAQWPRKR